MYLSLQDQTGVVDQLDRGNDVQLLHDTHTHREREREGEISTQLHKTLDTHHSDCCQGTGCDVDPSDNWDLHKLCSKVLGHSAPVHVLLSECALFRIIQFDLCTRRRDGRGLMGGWPALL